MRKLTFILFSIFSICTYSQNKACKDFKTGTFKYIQADFNDWKIQRTDTIQIETNTATGLVIHNAVKWISDCEFTLTCTKVSQPSYAHVIGNVFEIIIIETSTNSYTCISKRNDVQPNDMKFKMIKID